MNYHPMADVITAYLRSKGVVPEQLTLFDIRGRTNGLSVSGDINATFAYEIGRLVMTHPARRVVNVPTGGAL